MAATKLTRFVLSNWGRLVCLSMTIGVAVFLITGVPSAQPADDPDLKVLKLGLGSGTVRSDAPNTGIDCGATCQFGFASTAMVTLRATADADSSIGRWDGDCATTPPGSATCTVNMNTARSVRVEFNLDPDITPLTEAQLNPAGIRAYLNANSNVNTPARFIRALPADYKQNWILMSRSESLQTGTAELPRILLPGANAQNVFTIGMSTSASYPGAHPNAIEYMQWDAAQKNFRFHEIVLDNIGAMGDAITFPDGSTAPTFPARPRGIAEDDAKCHKCHSTRNVLNVDRTVFPAVRGSLPGTDGIVPNPITHKNKPNWDTYDSWGGMMPFNRDRIYQGSLEAAAFRKIFNLWNWSTNNSVRSILEQLDLQPSGVPSGDQITREVGGPNDGLIRFAFDPLPPAPPVTSEPLPTGSASPSVTYSFDSAMGPSPGTAVIRGGTFLTLHHSASPTNPEGRAVQLFDLIGGFDGSLNQQRIVDELITHRIAPGSVAIDVRPVALAITMGCLTRSNAATAITGGLGFFTARNDGKTIDQIFADTLEREQSIPLRKADIERLNLDRTNFDGSADIYISRRPVSTPAGLLQLYGAGTSSTTTGLERLRQEIFRRPTTDEGFRGDSTVMGGFYVDREDYIEGLSSLFNPEKVTVYRYFLEPLGVSVDKWSMGVRGRSRTYTFADVFKLALYVDTLTNGLTTSLTNERFPGLNPPFTCGNVMTAVNNSFAGLASDGSGPIPTYTDVQRIFNKSCVECHGGLLYPPYRNYLSTLPEPGATPDPVNPFREEFHLDFSEEEYPTRAGRRRMERSFDNAVGLTASPPENSQLYRRITAATEDCPYGLMPCGGPRLTPADIKTILRWIAGPPAAVYSEGDPHIKTVDGINYDFQSAGEFTLLRGENLEIQARQIPVETGSPLSPNDYTGLSSCVSLNGAVALRIGGHRVTYQPNISGEPDPSGLQLRIDGKLSSLSAEGIPLGAGVRIVQSTAPGGIRIEAPGGTAVIITPNFWEYRQLWYMNIDVRRARATEGVMGAIAPGSWLPALPDGNSLGPRPSDLHQRYIDLYEKFENAWRVNDSTTLFDYAPGTSTSTFTIESWPVENAQSCTLIRFPEGQQPKPPLQALPLEVAQQNCNEIADADRKKNCVLDVMVTGETQFARTYALTEQIERNASPTAPLLGFPGDYVNNKTDLALPITLTWSPATDPDGDVVTYRQCLWPLGERPNNNKCVSTAIETTSKRKGVFLWGLLVALLVFLLLLVFLIAKSTQRKPVLLILVAVAILASIVLAFYIGKTKTSYGKVTKTVAGLKPGQEYFWKVIAEDGKGGIAESETWRFKTR